MGFFPKKLFWFWILKKKIRLDRRKKYIPTWHFHSIIIYLPFSKYNHIQNFEEKKLFQHFANLIKIRSTHLLPILDLIIPPLPEVGGGYTVLPLSVRHIFLSNYWWQKSDIWSQASHRYAISWEAFLEPSDSYFLFADLVGFYPHWTYMHIFLNNYWWQKSGIWSQASYRYPISWEVAGVS